MSNLNQSSHQSINQFREAGDKVRELKTAKADKAAIDAAVKVLLENKAAFKAETGEDGASKGAGKEIGREKRKKGKKW